MLVKLNGIEFVPQRKYKFEYLKVLVINKYVNLENNFSAASYSSKLLNFQLNRTRTNIVFSMSKVYIMFMNLTFSG